MKVVDNVLEKNQSLEDDVKDCQDKDSIEQEESEETSAISESKEKIKSVQSKVPKTNAEIEDEEEESSSAEDEDACSECSDDEEESNHMVVRRKTKAKAITEERRIETDKNKSKHDLRVAIVCVLSAKLKYQIN